MSIRVRQAIRISCVVPVVVTVLRPIDSQPPKRRIDDLLVKEPKQRRHAGYLSTGRVLLERRLNFRVCGAQFRIGWPKALIDDAVKRLGSFEAPVSASAHPRET